MKQTILNYLKAMKLSNRTADLTTMNAKFPGVELLPILNELSEQGLIYEPMKGIWRWLG